MCFVNALPVEATFHLANGFILASKFSARAFEGSEFMKFEGEEGLGCMWNRFTPSQWSSVILEKVVK
jgi:hypothetical protein